MHDEAADGDEDAGVGHVESGPGMREWHVKIEEREIDDVTMEEAVGQVPHDPAEEQGQGDIAQRIAQARPPLCAVVVSVYILFQISGDGETNWIEGVQLLSVYIILGILFFYLPEPHIGSDIPQ
jgi:hypothetical protein